MFSMRTKRQFIANFGFNTFLEAEWVRLRIPSLLRTFWLTRMMQQLLSMIAKSGISSDQGLQISDQAARVALTYMLEVGRELIIRGAETLIALLGMTRYNFLFQISFHKSEINTKIVEILAILRIWLLFLLFCNKLIKLLIVL